MPIYEYQASTEQHCEYCAAGFELIRKITASELAECPKCKAPVERKISAPNIGGSGPSLDSSEVEKHGFTQYKRAGKGVYEKTAGKGPKVISDN